MKKILYYISLVIYYSIGMRVPKKFGGEQLRYQLVKNIFRECGKNVRIAENVYFGMGKNIILKDNAGIGKGSKILGNGMVVIGSNNIMGPEVMFITGDHKISIDNNSNLINERIVGNIFIGDETYIGARVTILQGVSIGERSIVGACSLVNKSIDVNTLVVGIPAKMIKDL